MQVIVIGAGKLGYNVARILSREHDVVMVEQDTQRATVVDETLDVRTVIGEWPSRSVLQQAGVARAGLVVATTEVDEVNIVACIIAKRHGAARTVARVRNPEYVSNRWFTPDTKQGIDLVISPEFVTAEEIAKLVRVPEAVALEYYAEGNIELLEVRVPGGAPAVGLPLKDVNFGAPVLVTALVRGEKVIIPRGQDSIAPNDRVFVIGRTQDVIVAERMLGQERRSVRSVFILGGGRIGAHLARLLQRAGLSVTVVERDRDRCRLLSGELDLKLVIHGDGADITLLREAGIEDTDLFVSTTADDKLNLLVSLVAKHLGVPRTIATIRRADYVHLVERVGLDVVVNPQSLAASFIQRFIHRSTLLSLHFLEGEACEALEAQVTAGAPVAGKRLQDLHFPTGAIIGAIFRNGGQVIIPSGKDQLMAGDRVVIFCLPQAQKGLDKLFQRR